MIPNGPADELSAVNEMLAAVGQDPVGSLEMLPPDGNTALFVLQTTARDFQEEGFWFNREADYELKPDAEGRITIPSSILSIDGMEADVVERWPYLYDRANKTHIFTAPVLCDGIFHRTWDRIPHAARRYITALAIEKFVDGFPGAQAVTEARERNLLRAKVAFERAVIRNEDLNLLNNDTIATLARRS